jgi:hypothetical protein
MPQKYEENVNEQNYAEQKQDGMLLSSKSQQNVDFFVGQ